VVYPDGTSIANLENEVLIQVTPTSVSNGTKNVAYPATTFTATGGAFTPPFIWSAPEGLPPGLSIVSNPNNTVTLSGTPTQSGTFDFILQLTDSLGRSVQWNYTITIQ
jgi:large repetitive protein